MSIHLVGETGRAARELEIQVKLGQEINFLTGTLSHGVKGSSESFALISHKFFSLCNDHLILSAFVQYFSDTMDDVQHTGQFEVDGMHYLSTFTYPESLRRIKNELKLERSDIVIVTYPRSGLSSLLF